MFLNRYISIFITLIFLVFVKDVYAQISVEKSIQKLKSDLHDTIRIQTLHKVVEGLIRKNKPDDAEPYLQQLKTLSEKIDYQLGKVHYLYDRSFIELKHKKHQEAIQTNQQAIEAYQQLLETRSDSTLVNDLAKSFYHMTRIYSETANWDKAVKYCLDAIKMYEQAKNYDDVGRMYNNIGTIYRSRGLYNKSVEALQKVIDLDSVIQQPEILTAAYINLAIEQYRRQEYTESIKTYKKGLEKSSHLSFKIYSLFEIGHIYQRHFKDDKQAFVYYDSAIVFCKEMPTDAQLINGYIGIAKSYAFVNNYTKAVDYYLDIISMVEVSGNHEKLARVYNSIAALYNRQSQKEKALEYFKKQLVILKKSKNQHCY